MENLIIIILMQTMSIMFALLSKSSARRRSYHGAVLYGLIAVIVTIWSSAFLVVWAMPC